MTDDPYDGVRSKLPFWYGMGTGIEFRCDADGMVEYGLAPPPPPDGPPKSCMVVVVVMVDDDFRRSFMGEGSKP